MVVCYSLDPIMKYIPSQATSSTHSTTTNGPSIRHLQLLPVYLQLSLVSPAITSRYTLRILRFTRGGEGKVILILETGIIAHRCPRNRDNFTGLDILRIPREDEISSSPRQSASPRI